LPKEKKKKEVLGRRRSCKGTLAKRKGRGKLLLERREDCHFLGPKEGGEKGEGKTEV